MFLQGSFHISENCKFSKGAVPLVRFYRDFGSRPKFPKFYVDLAITTLKLRNLVRNIFKLMIFKKSHVFKKAILIFEIG